MMGSWCFIFHTQKIPTSESCLPQKIPTFLAYPKNPTPAINCAYLIVDLSWWKAESQKSHFFLRPKKSPCVFHRPQNIAFGQNCRPKKPISKICQWCPCHLKHSRKIERYHLQWENNYFYFFLCSHSNKYWIMIGSKRIRERSRFSYLWPRFPDGNILTCCCFPKFSKFLKIIKTSKNYFWTVFRRFLNTSEDFRRFSENFKNHKNIWKLLLNCFRTLPKISEDFPKI